MAGEIKAAASSGIVVYAHILNTAAKLWNGTTFETYAAGDYANYTVTLTEQGSSGVFVGDFPSGITTADIYQFIFYEQAGGSPVQGDPIVGTGNINWTGSAVVVPITPVSASTGSEMLAYIKRAFKRPDKDTEIFDALTDTVKDMKRRFEFDEIKTETDTTDTISVLGDYKIDAESDLGLIIGDVVLRDGNQSNDLDKLTKQDFDRLYPNPTASNVLRGRPKHWCFFAGQILFGPVPDSTSYTYHISYTSDDGTAIDSSTTAVPFSGPYREILKFGTLARVYADLGYDADAAKFGQVFEFGMLAAIAKEKKNTDAPARTAYCGA